MPVDSAGFLVAWRRASSYGRPVLQGGPGGVGAPRGLAPEQELRYRLIVAHAVSVGAASACPSFRVPVPPTIRRQQMPVTRSRRGAARVQSAEHVVLGGAVRETRARRQMSQEGLGFAARMHRNYVGAIERGEINPTWRVLRKLAHGLDVPLSELIALFETRFGEGSGRRRRSSSRGGRR
jgi:DNA-binding XRE family transcriptional regulator